VKNLNGRCAYFSLKSVASGYRFEILCAPTSALLLTCRLSAAATSWRWIAHITCAVVVCIELLAVADARTVVAGVADAIQLRISLV
jgi:glycerol dehydrogenase-like iron-containing ADH family enzyme